ncbi:MbcA/ParS/Xre antitoxin family protein [Ahrensia sp. R2A130]|uniref:MbcA/ParS/Xre antitoxin family protein n=1 Tax=Ahrensia sp. R2A130 TaxID=744979 RepID=UPI0001E0845A|nr:MbcA/ParS/Xre antitoxin family protein [Ahrensia sp. R2A130]EFL87455.1 toxin-antitoxin system, antitoxin component, Xre family [Ahrensia sp. R2A130]
MLALTAENGLFVPRRIADLLRTTLEEVARTAGLGRDAVSRADRVKSPRTQRRLREMVEVLNKVEPRFGSPLLAYAWLRSQPLAGFDGATAMDLIREDRQADVLDYIDAVDAGVFA